MNQQHLEVRTADKDTQIRLLPFWVLTVLAVVFTASVDVDVEAQAWFAASLVFFMVVARRFCEHGLLRVLYLGVIAFLSIRYLAWRTLDTLHFTWSFDAVAMVLLYLAEVYAIALGLLGMVVCIQPISRPTIKLPENESKLPSVDVFITTYNEPIDMVEVTLYAALQMSYPRDKLNIYLLDDGGTNQKLTSLDAKAAEAAKERALALKKICQESGAYYHTRFDNQDHKAGNVNAALRDTHGDLVVIFDADHVPTIDFLEKTVGYFTTDEKLFLVQTPHFFINADPVEKNLEVFERMPAEHEMFHRLMQKGLDYWNAALFSGSAAILRRKYLEEIGGFATTTVTEDAETGLELHSRGYNSVFVSHPLVSGLAPESLIAFMVQRVRWATGMLQILVLKNPLRRAGLSVSQKICYLSNSLYWLFPLPRIVFLLAPTMFLLFGMHIYEANVAQIVAYTVPHYWASLRLSNFLYGRVRWPFVSTLYETLQSFFALGAIFKVFSSPRSPTFAVTPKGMHLESDAVSPLAAPFYVVFVILLLATITGIYRYFYGEKEEQAIVFVVGLWHMVNFLLVFAALGALVELRQRRSVPRVAANNMAVLLVGDQEVSCQLMDISTNGVGIITPVRDSRIFKVGDIVRFRMHSKLVSDIKMFKIILTSVRQDRGNFKLGARFLAEGNDFSDIVVLARGDSSRWERQWEQTPDTVNAIQALFLLLWWGVKHSQSHVIYILQSFRLVIRYAINGFKALFSLTPPRRPRVRKDMSK